MKKKLFASFISICFLQSLNANTVDRYCILDVEVICQINDQNEREYYLEIEWRNDPITCREQSFDFYIIEGYFPNSSVSETHFNIAYNTLLVPLNNITLGNFYDVDILPVGNPYNGPYNDITYTINIDTFSCMPIQYSPYSCCPDLENLYPQGHFNIITNSPTQPISTFLLQTDLTNNVLLPGQYSFITNSDLGNLPGSWNIQDNTDCGNINSQSNFIVYNGNTGLSTSVNEVLYYLTMYLEQDSIYTLCFDVKDLDQCAFNVQPMISVLHDGQPILNNYLVDTDQNDPCDWDKINIEFNANSINYLEIYNSSLGGGDGNDIALDNISLHKKQYQEVEFTFNYINVTPRSYSIEANISNLSILNQGCKYAWIIGEVNANGNFSWGNVMIGGSDFSPNWGTTTMFEGFNSGSGLAGVFNPNRNYRIYLTVYDCTCKQSNSALINLEPLTLPLPRSNKPAKSKHTNRKEFELIMRKFSKL